MKLEQDIRCAKKHYRVFKKWLKYDEKFSFLQYFIAFLEKY
jgi:hypothetical protein